MGDIKAYVGRIEQDYPDKFLVATGDGKFKILIETMKACGAELGDMIRFDRPVRKWEIDIETCRVVKSARNSEGLWRWVERDSLRDSGFGQLGAAGSPERQ